MSEKAPNLTDDELIEILRRLPPGWQVQPPNWRGHPRMQAADRLEQLLKFYRAVAKAAGDLTGLPGGHAFNIVWAFDGEPDKDRAFITADMIRRAAFAADGNDDD